MFNAHSIIQLETIQMKKILPVLLILLASSRAGAQIQVTTATPQQGLDVLIGNNVSYSFISSQGSPSQFGIFNGTNSNIGFSSGMVLSTAVINPPNGFAPPATLTGAGTPGAAILNNLGLGNTNNAAVVTFSFTPVSDTIKFRYVFASNEYPVYVCSGFNDVFAFFLSGPNPGGGNYNNTNIALIPGTNTPVMINSVNAGNSSGTCNPPGGGGPCPCNPQYFVNNYSPNQGTVNINGFTTPLTAVAAVVPCSTYTITLAVADVLDGALNSAVFLEANSFISPQVTINPTASIGGVDTLLYEGCSYADIEILRNYDLDQQKTYYLQITGTAVDGTDYTGIPQTVTFPPGSSSQTFTLNTLSNLTSNSNTTLTITIQDTICATGGVITSSITLNIINVNPLQVDIGPDLFTCDTINIQPVVTGGLPPYTYDWNNGQFNTPNISNYILTNPQQFILAVSDNCAYNDADTLQANILNAPTAYFGLSANTYSVNEECGTVEITFTRQELLDQARTYPITLTGTATQTDDYIIPATFSFGVNQNTTTVTLTPVWDNIAEGNETVIVTTTDTLCNGMLVYESIEISIINKNQLSMDAGNDVSTGCPIVPQNLAPVATGGTTPYTWSWSSGENTQNITAEPAVTTTYTVTMTDSCGNSISDEIQVETYYPPIAEFGFNSANWCEPSIVLFSNASVPQSGQITNYSWDLGNGELTPQNNPAGVYYEAGEYTVTLIVTNSYNCTDTISKTLTIRPKPTANFYWEPAEPSVNNPDVNLLDHSSDDASGWLWQIATLFSSTDQNTQYTFTTPGEYPVTLYIVNEFGCTDTAYNTIIVTGVSTIYIPSAFTPNNDNLNQTFMPLMTNMREFSMRIYNRWGELMYSTENPLDKGWDGRAPNGNPLKNDVYVYKIYVKDVYGKESDYYGNVLLLSDK
jgi:gliding motility-associated-like protein